MPQSSTGSFTDADEYTGSLADIIAELIVQSRRVHREREPNDASASASSAGQKSPSRVA